jgi:DNA-directed RNA polymerase specialized sigma24 family protein
MDEHAWLAARFEEHRTRLRAVAYRMLGSLAEADEAVQDAWLRVSRLGAGEIGNLSGQNRACLSTESQQNRGATDY